MESQEYQWITATLALSRKKIEFNRVALGMMSTPIVYMALGDKDVLYIGMSEKGLGRVFARDHHVLKHIMGEIRSLQVFEVDSPAAARTLEAVLIKNLKPTRNRRGYKKNKPKTVNVINMVG